ncbi:hypothetical protein ElyMa_003487700 [Elysia marginata]|uniref:Uncharacterized protein n=1 Tax=Elysia marginata TaxID=1093978 RepID=A0AAV4ECQ3_9GAST|nr:hypothetical protein ElyMa_003487700 [Elysia marginata]
MAGLDLAVRAATGDRLAHCKFWLLHTRVGAFNSGCRSLITVNKIETLRADDDNASIEFKHVIYQLGKCLLKSPHLSRQCDMRYHQLNDNSFISWTAPCSHMTSSSGMTGCRSTDIYNEDPHLQLDSQVFSRTAAPRAHS